MLDPDEYDVAGSGDGWLEEYAAGSYDGVDSDDGVGSYELPEPLDRPELPELPDMPEPDVALVLDDPPLVAPPARLKNAVTSPPVETMLTTVHPSADLSVSLDASAAGSKEDELTVVNSMDMGVTVPRMSMALSGVAVPRD